MKKEDNFDEVEFIDMDNSNSSTELDSTNDPSFYVDLDASSSEDIDSDDDEDSEAEARRRAARASRRKKKKQQIMIRRIAFVIALLVFLISGTILIKNLLDYKRADDIYAGVEDSVFSLPTISNGNGSSGSTSEDGSSTTTATDSTTETKKGVTLLTNYNHQALLDINSESVGYLQIPALDILLPVVQGSDNDYYLNHSITGESSKNGTLFVDARNSEGIESKNTIIYGHNMKNGAMFGSLKKYIDKNFFNEDENKYFYLYTGNKIYKYEIYSVHTTPATSTTYTTVFESTDAFFSYLNSMSRASYHSNAVDFTSDSKTITLSTCTNDSETRLVVQAVRIETITN